MGLADVCGGIGRRACVEPLEGRRLLAATFYVSPRGNDANVGTDPQHAWRHIQQAMSAATPGSTVLVMPGVYNEKLTVNVSGEATDGFITFQAQGHVTISGSRIAGADIINLNNQNYVRIVGFNIVNDLHVSDGSGIRMNGHDDHVEILNNTIHGVTGANAMAITAYGTDPFQGISNLVVDGNQIFNCRPFKSEALTLNGNVHDFRVSNNYVHDVNNIGIDFIGGEGMSPDPATDVARNGSVFGNRVTRAHQRGLGSGVGTAAGIVVDGAQNVTVERNTCWADDVGVEVTAVSASATATGVIVRDNYVYENWGVGISLGASQQTDGIVTACQISNNTLFHDNVRHTSDGELRLQWGSANAIENNLISASARTILLDVGSGSANNTSDYNLFYAPGAPAAAEFRWDGLASRGLALLQALSRQDAHSQFANPMLLRPGGSAPRLSSRSPAINAGDPAFIPAADETDYAGNPRLLGSSIDIGAMEVG